MNKDFLKKVCYFILSLVVASLGYFGIHKMVMKMSEKNMILIPLMAIIIFYIITPTNELIIENFVPEEEADVRQYLSELARAEEKSAINLANYENILQEQHTTALIAQQEEMILASIAQQKIEAENELEKRRQDEENKKNIVNAITSELDRARSEEQDLIQQLVNLNAADRTPEGVQLQAQYNAARAEAEEAALLVQTTNQIVNATAEDKADAEAAWRRDLEVESNINSQVNQLTTQYNQAVASFASATSLYNAKAAEEEEKKLQLNAAKASLIFNEQEEQKILAAYNASAAARANLETQTSILSSQLTQEELLERQALQNYNNRFAALLEEENALRRADQALAAETAKNQQDKLNYDAKLDAQKAAEKSLSLAEESFTSASKTMTLAEQDYAAKLSAQILAEESIRNYRKQLDTAERDAVAAYNEYQDSLINQYKFCPSDQIKALIAPGRALPPANPENCNSLGTALSAADQDVSNKLRILEEKRRVRDQYK